MYAAIEKKAASTGKLSNGKFPNFGAATKSIALACAIVLGACATATPYQPANDATARNGFSDIKIENDRARISFDGNSLTKRDTVETYLLYRAAELARENGFDYFTLTERAVDKKTRIQPTGFSNYHDPYYGYFDYSYFHPRYGWGHPRIHSPFNRHRAHFDPFYSRLGFDGWGYSGFGSGFGNDFDYREISRYRASAEVKFGRGSKPHNADNAFNAKEVLENLGPRIVYPEQEA